MAEIPAKHDLKPSPTALTNTRLVAFLQEQVFRLWNVPYRGRWTSPCMHPVSITRSQWKDVVDHLDDYVVGEKADGVQYFLLLTRTPKGQDVSVMIDRAGNMYAVSVLAGSEFFNGTLVVGELAWVQEYLNPSDLTSASVETGTVVPVQVFDSNVSKPGVWRQKFKVFSNLVLRGERMYDKHFQTRHSNLCDVISIEDDPIKDTDTWLERASQHAQQGKIVCAGNEFCLMFVLKPWHTLRNFSALTRTTNQVTNPFDGFIIQHTRMSERPGRKPGCFKWKAVNTLDFGHQGNPKALYVQHGPQVLNANESKLIQFEGKTVEFIPQNLPHESDALSYAIGEFVCTILGIDKSSPDADGVTHEVLKIAAYYQEMRKEKNSPNDTITINNTLVNIVENMTLDEIIRDVQTKVQEKRQVLTIMNLPGTVTPNNAKIERE